MDDMRYFFEKNVRIKVEGQNDDEVTCIKSLYPSAKDAEVAFHNEVAYGLSLNTLVLAYYAVTNERGKVYLGLTRLIDNTENYENTDDKKGAQS